MMCDGIERGNPEIGGPKRGEVVLGRQGGHEESWQKKEIERELRAGPLYGSQEYGGRKQKRSEGLYLGKGKGSAWENIFRTKGGELSAKCRNFN